MELPAAKELRLKREAHKVYRWLRFSPLLTIPMMLWWLLVSYDSVAATAAFLPLIVHIPLLAWGSSPNRFVKRHAQQGMMLVVLRALCALYVLNTAYDDSKSALFYFLLLNGSLWYFGSRWGYQQVARGACWLMSRRGEQDHLLSSRDYDELETLIAAEEEGTLPRLENGVPKTQAAPAVRRPPRETLAWLKMLEDKGTFDRQRAAAALGRVAESDEAIIRALQYAVNRDPNPYVRAAAEKALLAPVHQAFLAAPPSAPPPAAPARGSQPAPVVGGAPAERYRAGKAALAAGKRREAVEHFAAAFRDGNAAARKKALAQLEELGAVEVF
jgi:hypothetical protein